MHFWCSVKEDGAREKVLQSHGWVRRGTGQHSVAPGVRFPERLVGMEMVLVGTFWFCRLFYRYKLNAFEQKF